MKTAKLEGVALDYWVARANGWKVKVGADGRIYPIFDLFNPFQPSTSWSQGGPIIDRKLIATKPWPAEKGWKASIDLESTLHCDLLECFGTTPLIAAMRCYVASEFGDEVPAEEGDKA